MAMNDMNHSRFMKQLNNLIADLSAKAQGVAARRAEWETLQEQVALLNTLQSDCYTLDIGGQHFHTAGRTLQQHGPHLLSALGSGQFACEAQCDGYTFIDRDPAHFASVLAYLRGQSLVFPSTEDVRRALYREARYFGLDVLIPSRRLLVTGLEECRCKDCKTYQSGACCWHVTHHVSDRHMQTWRKWRADCHIKGSSRCVAFSVCTDREWPVFLMVLKSGIWILQPNKTCQWEHMADLPEAPLEITSAVMCRDQVWVLVIQWSFRKHLYVWDVQARRWDGIDLPVFLDEPRLFVFQGRITMLDDRGYLYLYHADNNTWAEIHWGTRLDPCVVEYQGRLLFIGGHEVGGEFNVNSRYPSCHVDAYHPQSQTLQRLPPLHVPHCNAAAVVVEDSVVVIGSSPPRQRRCAVEQYDAGLGAWQLLPDMPTSKGCKQRVAASVHVPGCFHA